MEKYSHNEILKALSVIQEICLNTSCCKCPFNTGNNCEITRCSPDTWDIRDEDETIWRAFF